MDPTFNDIIFNDNQLDLYNSRVYGDPIDPLHDWTREKLMEYCRFPPDSITDICNLVRDQLETSNTGWTIFID